MSSRPTEHRIRPPRWVCRFVRRVHRDEQGAISVLSVFTVFMFTILLVMVVNIGRHVDDKIRMQNAADAAAYSGGVTMARGMNAVAFGNHLLSEIFALTAYMREGRDRNAEQLVPPILTAWQQAGQVFESAGRASGFVKFEQLGRAIQQKVPLEQDVVTKFGEMTFQQSQLTLPVFEYILSGDGMAAGGPQSGGGANPLGGFIPQFQRAVVRTVPLMADSAADEIARRYGKSTERLHKDVPLQARLWRTDVQQVRLIDESNPFGRTLPAIDPSPTGPDGGNATAYTLARAQRKELAHDYLEQWIADWMGPYFGFDGDFRPGRETAAMSNFINLWRVFACGHLTRLLDEEYPDTNLPHVLRDDQSGGGSNARLERDHTWVSVVYWPHMSERFPGLFRNPLSSDGNSDAAVFAQVSVFIPKARYRCCPWLIPLYSRWGQFRGYATNMDNWPDNRWPLRPGSPFQPPRWDLFNQNWTVRLVPATSESVVRIVQTNPGIAGFRPPNLGTTDMRRIRQMNMH